MPAGARRYARRVLSFGDTFGWAFRDPEWARKLVLQGLIGLIPIVGWIALYGWMLQCLDNLRTGRQELAEPGFPLGRGVEPWLPLLVLGIVINIVPRILTAIGGAISQGAGSPGAAAAGGALVFVGSALLIVCGIGASFMTVATCAAAYEGGMGAAFNYPKVLQRAFQHPAASALGIVGLIIAGFGGILCGIGVFLTLGYGMSIVAGLATSLVTGGAPSFPGGPGYGRMPGGYSPYGPQQAAYPPQPGAYGQQPGWYGRPPAPPYGEQQGWYAPPGGYGQQPPSPYGQPPSGYPSAPAGQGYPGAARWPGQYPPPGPGHPPAPGTPEPESGSGTPPPPDEPAQR